MILPLQSANLEVEYPWNWEQIQADAELIKNTNTNILPDFEFTEMATDTQYKIFWTLQVLDVYSTYRGLKYRCVYEANPIVGPNPDLARLVTHKTVFLHPIAIAPELTIMIFLFCIKRSFISLENSVSHFCLIFLLLSISNDDPILITTFLEFLRYIR